MSTASACGVVSVSIDTEAPSPSSTLSPEALDSVVVELFDRFQKQRVSATWMIGQPQRHLLAARIARDEMQELALSGGSIAQLLQCRRAGLNISTVPENPAWQQRDVDLLAKHGISVIRGTGACGVKRRLPVRGGNRGLQAVRYGVWYVPVSTTLRGGGWVPYFAQLQIIKRTIEQVVRQVGICHVRIDAASIARSEVASGLRAVERLLRQLDHLQASHHVTIETLRDMAIRLQPMRTSPAASSILRAA